MCKKLTIISGKGGSGKTSFSLAFSKMLSNIKLKVLLIDCDMSTHGATFFMKPRIERHRVSHHKLISVDDILLSSGVPPYGFFFSPEMDKSNDESQDFQFTSLLKVENNLYFLPSDVSISNSKPSMEKYKYHIFKNTIEKEIEGFFDIIIFDCQAGYSEFTRSIVSYSDLCLLISEPDSVSAAANRALCFQMGIELQYVQSFQLFNKITEAESEHYSKTATSAFFTNLPPIVFNWAVRTTFVYSQIPSDDTVDIKFGKDILKVLGAMFPEYNEEMNSYQKMLNDKQRLYLKNQIVGLEYQEKLNKKNRLLKVMQTIIPILTSIALIVFFAIQNQSKDNLIIILTVSLITLILESLLLTQRKYTYERLNIESKQEWANPDMEIILSESTNNTLSAE